MNQDITAILLPAARVDFFALDDGTAATAEKLAADWRFARVGLQVVRSGIDAAVKHYTDNVSPEIIIIETNDIGDAFIAQLGQLAGVCAEGTDAVIIGPMNDVHLYRSLVGMGVRDYLVRPVAENDLVGVIAKALVEKRGIAGSRLVTVLGSNGGVGATSIAQMLAWNISENLKQKTILIDAAGSGGSLGIGFGIEPSTHLAEAVRIGQSGTEDDMKRIVQGVSDNLSLMVCGGDAMLGDLPDPEGVETLVSRLMQKNPIVLMDLSGASAPVQKRMLALSSHVVLVTTPFLPALRNARALMTEIKAIRSSLKELDMVLNMQGHAAGEEVSTADIGAMLEKAPAVKIPYASKIFAGGEMAGKAARVKGAEDILKSLLDVSIRATGKDHKPEESKDAKKSGNPFAFLKKKGS